ncbi:MAG TPA: hypothetical protein VIH21_07915 [Dehalococcoidia bacterium]
MDRLTELAEQLSLALARLQNEAASRDIRELVAPLAWLDEANGWLNYELDRLHGATGPESVPFTYIPVHLRR